MDNIKRVSYSGTSAIITGGVFEKNLSNSHYTVATFTTREPHNFYVGSLVSIDSPAAIYTYVIPIVDIDRSRKTLSSVPYSGAVRFKVEGKYKDLFKTGDLVQVSGNAYGSYNGTFPIIWSGLSTSSGYYYFSVLNDTGTEPASPYGAASVPTRFLYNKSVFKVNSPTSFSIKLDREIPTDVGAAIFFNPVVPGTATAVNAPLGLVNLNYAQPTY